MQLPPQGLYKTFYWLNGTCLALVLLAGLVNARAAGRLAALVGSLYLVAVLLVPTLTAVGDKLPWGRVVAGLQRANGSIAGLRRPLGLWATAWLSLHAIISVALYFDGPAAFLALAGRQPVTLLETVALAILLLMALTSWPAVQRRLPGWKSVHAAVWAVPAIAAVTSVVAARQTLGQLPLLMLAPLLLAACVVAAGLRLSLVRPWNRAEWLRLGFLLAGCGAAVWAAVATS